MRPAMLRGPLAMTGLAGTSHPGWVRIASVRAIRVRAAASVLGSARALLGIRLAVGEEALERAAHRIAGDDLGLGELREDVLVPGRVVEMPVRIDDRGDRPARLSWQRRGSSAHGRGGGRYRPQSAPRGASRIIVLPSGPFSRSRLPGWNTALPCAAAGADRRSAAMAGKPTGTSSSALRHFQAPRILCSTDG